MTDVYYIEDDIDIGMGVKEYLESKSFAVTIYSTIAVARTALLQKQPAIVLVDWNMPDGNGADLCEWIRRKWSTLPLIFLTVKSDSKDIIKGFQNGADDYVVKPFELEILYSRMCALMRRIGTSNKQRYLSCDNISLDSERIIAFNWEKEVSLSQTEYQLLYILMSNKGKTITRERLLEQVWDSNGNYVNNNTLTVTMKRLREKLDLPSCIKTVRSFGYRMEDTI